MVDSGGIRADITLAANVVPDENRNPRWTVRDAAGVPATDFTNLTASFYYLPYPDAPLAEALYSRTTAAGAIDKSTPPYLILGWVPADWTGREYDDTPAYELWRTDANNVRRIAYGTIEIRRARQAR